MLGNDVIDLVDCQLFALARAMQEGVEDATEQAPLTTD